MRILLLNYEFPPLGGGAATASAQIAAHMARRGAEVAVLTSHFRGLPRRERRDGYTIYRVPVMRGKIDRCSVPEMGTFVLGSALPAVRLVRRFKPDVIHVFFGIPTGIVGLLASKFSGAPYLLSLRGGDVPGFMGKELAAMHRAAMPLTKLVWSNAGVIVANSQGLRDLARRTAPNRAIEIVPNGVDLDLFRPAEEPRAPGDKVRFLFVGRLANQKGLNYLLESLARFEPGMLAHVELELVGDGPEEERLRAQAARLGLGSSVKFAGWVAREEIVQHYQAADAFVLPSLDEGLPNVMLEAMACGKALVATDISGNRELVRDGENGLLVPVGDVSALTEALRRVVTNPELRAEMGRKSRNMAAAYSWARTADRYLSLSEAILARRSATAEKRERQTSTIE
ncbi:MAG TPA: glycosyltransferase [Chloroflexia bacterium]|nr:glycosyltransferase [Chloroflexia bacterium]